MPVETISPTAAVLSDPYRYLGGTDITTHLVLGRMLLNTILDERPDDTPVKKLYIDPDANNRFVVHVAAVAPVIGTVSRNITLVPGPPVSFPEQPWLRFDIVDGLGFLDKPLINLLQGIIESKLPKGVDISGSYFQIHVPAVLNDFGYEALVPLIRHLQIRSEANQLILELEIDASNPPPAV